MRKICPNIIENIDFFASYQKNLSQIIEEASLDNRAFFKKIDKYTIEYLILNEHIDLAQELISAEIILCCNIGVSNKDVSALFLELYSCLRDQKYSLLESNVNFINDSLKYNINDYKKKLTAIYNEAISLIKKQTYNHQLFNYLDDILRYLSKYKIESDTINHAYIEKKKLLDIYQSRLKLLESIKYYISIVQENDMNNNLQEEIFEDLKKSNFFEGKFFGEFLSPYFDDLLEELNNESIEEQKILLLIKNCNQVLFEYGFGTPCFSVIKSPLLSLVEQDDLDILKDFIKENHIFEKQYKDIVDAIEVTNLYNQYQDLSANIESLQKFASYKRVLFTLAEFKSIVLSSSKEKQSFWKYITNKLEDNILINKKYNHALQMQAMRFTKRKQIFSDILKLKINMLTIQEYYTLTFERFSNLLGIETNRMALYRQSWLSNREVQKNSGCNDNIRRSSYYLKQPENDNVSELSLYEKFQGLITSVLEFKDSKTINFDSVSSFDYLDNFEIKTKQDFLNKKLAYKVLYKRSLQLDHTKIYEKIYSLWVEIYALYSDGFDICNLKKEVDLVNEYLYLLKENSLNKSNTEISEKSLSTISALYKKCIDMKMCEKIKEKIGQDNQDLNTLETILKKDNLSKEDAMFLQKIKEKIKKDFLSKKNNSSKFYEKMSESCKDKNPLFGVGEKITELKQEFEKLNLGDKSSFAKINDLLSVL